MNEQRAVIQQMVDALDHADELLGGNDTLVMNGAAAGRWLLEQPAVQEPIYQMQMMDGKWIDQAKQSYEYNKAHGNTVRIVYTTPPAAQPAPVQEPVAWMVHMPIEEANVDKSVRMTSCKVVAQEWTNPIPLYTAPQPVPVKTYSDGKPWPVQPVPHECQTEAEKTAYAFGWWKAMEYVREHGVIK